jgi:fumarylacetoacetate (FAA) hydrolase family protein
MISYKDFDPKGIYVGRIWRPDVGPTLVRIEGENVFDITSRDLPTMHDLLEVTDPAATARATKGVQVTVLDALVESSLEAARTGDANALRLLAPPDLQAIKASGVTFAESMVERVIEERAAGNADLAEGIRARVKAVIGDSLSGIKPGSEAAIKVKSVLQDEGLWSQYLEVGIGPDAEVFTKSQPMGSVGYGAQVGLHPMSNWNNPEPEIVLAISSKGKIVGATLGNDVNLRDIEGRSALLLGKAKDNNASCAIGPFLRLFDADFTLDDIRVAELSMRVEGEDGFVMEGHSSMIKISRDPADIVAQTIGRHHQYPDGFFLFLGTMFAPVKDRDAAGQGFTHHVGDVVSIHEAKLGTLRNTVRLSTDCPEWRFGTAALMRNLAKRGLI